MGGGKQIGLQFGSVAPRSNPLNVTDISQLNRNELLDERSNKLRNKIAWLHSEQIKRSFFTVVSCAKMIQ